MQGPSYRAQRPVLVRAPLHQDLPVPPLPDLADTAPAGAAARRVWLHQAWAVDELADAVSHASPSLGGTITALIAAPEPENAAVERAVRSLAAYALRAVRRPTPFGLFAGVREGEFADRARGNWGTGHTVVASAGAQWLADVVDRLVADPAVRTRVSVAANNVVRVNGDRLVVPWRRRRGGEEGTAVRCVSLRHTGLVRALLTAAATPVPYQEAVDKAAAEAGADTARVGAVLDLLIEQQAMLTALTPPTTATDQIGHVRAVLRAAGVDRGGAKGLVGALEDIGSVLDEHNQRSSDGRVLRSRLRERMLPWSASQEQLCLDVVLDADVALPREVAWEAEKAAVLVARLSAEPAGTAAWTRYRRRFADRYGHGVLVPVGDLLDPATGLGLPEDFHGTGRSPSPALSHRDVVLLAHAQQAAGERRELVLDDSLISELTRDQPHPGRGPATVELKTAVHAATRADLDTGRFTLLVNSVSRGWGHFSGGRFATLLANDGAPAPGGLLATLAGRPAGTSGADPVQLAYPGLRRSNPGVTTLPRLGPALITLSEPPAPADTGTTPPPIALDDLAVLFDQDTDRLHLVRLSTRQVLEPFTPHPLQLEFLTPTTARFLEELQRGQDARLTNMTGLVSTWDWGAARLLPHLPRVRAGRTVLSPATWDVSHAGLPGPDASAADWREAFTALTDRWGIPDHVHVHVQWNDQRRTLDLTDPAHLAMLRDQLERTRPAGRNLLVEAEPADGYGWCDGRPHEIIMLLSSRTQAPPPTTPRTAPVAQRGDTHMPGASRHVSVRLDTAPAQLPLLLTQQLPSLIGALGEPLWWVTRDEEHPGRARLTVRMPGPEAAAPALRSIGRWAEDLAAAGALNDLAFIPYRSQPGIWGAGPLLSAAENVLAADTGCVIHQHAQPTGRDPLVLAALNVLALAAGFSGSLEAGLTWIGAQPKPASTQPLHRDLAQAVRERSRTRPYLAFLADLPGGRVLAERLWPQREEALAAYAALLGGTGRCPDAALHHLVHAHLRLALDHPCDRATAWRLARSAALASPHHRDDGAPQPGDEETARTGRGKAEAPGRAPGVADGAGW